MIRKLQTGSSSSFYIQLYEIVDDRSSDQIISWSKNSNNSFIVWDFKKLQRDILSKSSGLGSRNVREFMKQVRCHGFKVAVKGPGELEFSHDEFLKKALSEKIQLLEAEIKSMRCRVKAKKATVKVEFLLQNLRI